MADFKKIWSFSGNYPEFAQIRQVQHSYSMEGSGHGYFYADFGPIWSQTLKYEGGYSDAATDNGNWTGGVQNSGVLIGSKYGISAPTLSKYLGRTATASDMQNLTSATAQTIAQANYWNPMQGDEIKNQAVAAICFDSIWNSGGNGANFIRQAINQIAGPGKVDGSSKSMAISSAELNIINSLDPQSLFNTILVVRDNFDNGLSSAKIYGKGWKNRLDSIYNMYAGSFLDVLKNPAQLLATAKKHKAIAITIAGIAAIGFVILLTGRKKVVYANQ